MADTETISLTDATALIAAALRAAGTPNAAALSVATALVAAEAEGQVGHGFSRLADYVAQARTGKIAADAEVRVTERGPASLLVDAGCGFGTTMVGSPVIPADAGCIGCQDGSYSLPSSSGGVIWWFGC